jgi:hypothetical protein
MAGKTIVVIDSNYETVTRIVFDYRQKNVYPYMESNGYKLDKFQGSLARRHYVGPAAKKDDVVYLCGVGHGNADCYTGDNGDPIFKVGVYDSKEAQGKIAHFISCQTARQLGPDFVKNGCHAYFGYDENFVFPTSEAEVFLECDSNIDLSFADGLTAQEVFLQVESLYKKRIKELSEAGKDRESVQLEFNYRHLRSPASGGLEWGSPGVSI